VPQVTGGARFGFAPGSSAQGVVAVGDVQAEAFQFDQLAFGIEGTVFCDLAGDPDFRPQGIVLAFAVSGGNKSVLLELTTFGYPVASEVVVELCVVFPDQLALAIPLVVGGAAQAVFAGFQAVFRIPPVTAGGALLALPFAFDQAAVAVVQLALGVGAGGTGGFPALAVEAAPDQGVVVNAQGVPAALMIVAVTDDCAIRKPDLFDPATGAISVTDPMAVLMLFGNLAKLVPHPVQFAVSAAGVGASAQGVILVVTGNGFTTFALAGLVSTRPAGSRSVR